MSEFFIYPLGLLGLTAIPIVILIYLLRSRYKTKNVSSTFIWKRARVKRRIPLNFIMSLLLILQILIVVAASFAIARPTIEPLKTEDEIIILDASASMLAKDGNNTRFDDAKEAIEKAAEDIGENHRMTLILAGEEAVKVVTRTKDKGEFLTALRPLECTMRGSDINKALDVAAEVLNQNKSAKVIVYTDKAYIDTDGIEIVDCKREDDWNAGVVSFEDELTPTEYEFITDIGNYGVSKEFSVKLLINGEVVSQRKITMAAGEIKRLRFTNSTTEDTGKDEIRVRLNEPITAYENATIELSAKDSFTFDDSLTIYPKEKKNPKILYISKYVVTEGGKKNANKSLLNFALKANGYTITSDDMYPDASSFTDFKGYDIYIFEGVMPSSLPTDGAIWFVDAKMTNDANANITSEFFENAGITIGDSVKRDETNGYLLSKSLSLDSVVTQLLSNVYLDIPLVIQGQEAPAAVMTYRPIESYGAAFKPIYKANDQDVFIAGNYKSVPVIMTTFDFANSSLIAYISDFPMLIKNMINYSVPEPVTQSTASLGDIIEFDFPVGAKTIERYLDGKLISSIDIAKYIVELEEQADGDPTFNLEEHLKDSFEITEPGKYEIVVSYPDSEADDDFLDDTKTYTITGHLSVEETSITERVPTESLKFPTLTNAQDDFERVEIFPYVIAVLIALLIIEWGVYYREQY